MFFIANTFKRQVHVFAGQVKIVSHSSCRTNAILKYFCPLNMYKIMYKFQSLKIVFILANSADPDEMLPYAAFHLDPHSQ